MKLSLATSLLVSAGLLGTFTLGCDQHQHKHHQDHDQEHHVHHHVDPNEDLHLTEEQHRELQGSPPWLDGWESVQAWREGGGRCQTHALSADKAARVNEEVLAWIAERNGGGHPGNGGPFDRKLQTITIPTHFHIIYDDNGFYEGVPFDVQGSIDVLNAAFAPWGFQFALVTTTGPHLNSFWYNAPQGAGSTDAEVLMKTALRVGGPDAMNVYVNKADRFLGWATLPWSGTCTTSAPNVNGVSTRDGIVVKDNTGPGNAWQYGAGDTLTHEVGHWLGLPHTFDGGCGGNVIADTPNEEAPYFGNCQNGESRDSCTLDPGNDPIENYMDYSDDACMDRFTADQATRMRAQWNLYRDRVCPGSTPKPTKAPTDPPTKSPTDPPTDEPTPAPVITEPTPEPTVAPTPDPTTAPPTPAPTTAPPTKTPTPNPTSAPCGGNKAACSSNSDCCSFNCKGGKCRGTRRLGWSLFN